MKLSDYQLKRRNRLKQSLKTIRHITGPVPHTISQRHTFDYGNVNFAKYVCLVLLSIAQYN